MSMGQSSSEVTLPQGVTVVASRETTQTAANGQNVQGMVFTLKMQSGAEPSVFVPYSLMSDTATVAKLFADRVAAINAVTALST